MTILEDEIDRRWPLPDVPFVGDEEGARLRTDYEASRARYRLLHPVVDRSDC